MTISPESRSLQPPVVVRGRHQLVGAAPPSGGDTPPPMPQFCRSLLCAASRGVSAGRGSFARPPPLPGCAGVAKHRTDGCPCARQCRRRRIRPTSSPRRCEGGLDQRVLGTKRFAHSCIYILTYMSYSQVPIPRRSRGRFVRDRPKLKVVETGIAVERLGICVRNGNTALRDAIDKAQAALIKQWLGGAPLCLPEQPPPSSAA